MTKINKLNSNNKGFTIVELLVVIVVIGILAAITIVSYTGITQRANTSSAQSAASNISSKAEVYMADNTTAPVNVYPPTLATLTGAASSTTWALSGITFNGTLLSAAPANPSTVNYFRCGTNGTATAPVAPATNITITTGGRVGYWNYAATPPAIAYDDIGQVSGVFNTFPVVCLITAS